MVLRNKQEGELCLRMIDSFSSSFFDPRPFLHIGRIVEFGVRFFFQCHPILEVSTSVGNSGHPDLPSRLEGNFVSKC